MEHDPYQIPSSDLTSAETYSGATNVTQRTITELAGTKPWVRLFAILGFLSSLVYIGLGATSLVFSAIGSEAFVDGFNSSMGSENSGAAMLFGSIYLVVGLIYLVPTLKLWKFGSAIGRLKTSASVQDLESALSYQRSFWKFLGVMTLLVIILAMVAGIGAVAFAASLGVAP